MRATRSSYENGDLVPIKTKMDRTIWCTLLDKDWQLSNMPKNVCDRGIKLPLFDEKACIVIADHLSFRHRNLFDNNILNTGTGTRTGKTTFSHVLKRIWESPIYQDPVKLNDFLERDNWKLEDLWDGQRFNVDECCFSMAEFRLRLSQALEGKGNFIILDEAGHGLFALEWWKDEHIDLIKEYQVIAKKRIISMFNVPHKDQLTHRMRDNAINLWTDCTYLEHGIDVERGFVQTRIANPQKWKMDIYWQPMIQNKFPPLNDEGWQRYDIKKDSFIAEQGILGESFASENKNKRETGYKRIVGALLLEMLSPVIDGKIRYREVEIARAIGKTKTWVSDNKLSEQQLRKEEMLRQAMLDQQLDKDKLALEEINKQNAILEGEVEKEDIEGMKGD